MFRTSCKRAIFLLIPLIGLASLARSQDSYAEPAQVRPRGSFSLFTNSPSNARLTKNAQDDVIRVDTNLVTIAASVMDREGRYIINLRKGDFQIFEDGVEQDISLFAPVEEPFTVLFLLDVSGSMSAYSDKLARAANIFLHLLHPDDQLIAASFDADVEVLSELSKAKDVWGRKEFLLRIAKDRAPVTMVYDAVDYALERMRKIRGRKAIVLFSDGVGSGESATAKGTLTEAEEQDSLIYTVQFNTYPDKGRFRGMVKTATNYMRDLAQKTGGRHYMVTEIAELESAFRLVAEELRRQYSLGYYAKNSSEAGRRRQVKVKVRRPNLVVRARDSYIARP